MRKLLLLLFFPITWFWKTRRRNKLVVFVLLVILALIILSQINKQPNQQYVLQPVERKTIASLVSETGNVNTSGRVDVYSSTTGIIEALYIENGQAVEYNQKLFKVKSTATDTEKAAAYANYLTTLTASRTAQSSKPTNQAALESARKNILDAQTAVDAMENRIAVSQPNPATHEQYKQNEIDSIRSALTTARQNFTAAEQKYKDSDANISSAQGSVTSTWLAYQATQDIEVKSPAFGTVANLSNKIGDKVTVNTLGTTAPTISPVLTLANLSDYSIKISLNESDIPKVQIGQSAQIKLDAIQDKKFNGMVITVDQVGTNTQGVITYNVTVDITDPTQQIRPAMTATVDIETQKAENVLTVPNSAIKPYQGKKTVQVLDPKTNKPEYVTVETGIKSPDRTEIKSGIEEGREVITAKKNSK